MNCDENCPTVGDECQDGSLSGTCQDNQCTYDPFLLIATCVTPPSPQGKKLSFSSKLIYT